VIEADGNRLRHIANGQLTTKTGTPLPQRLASLGEQLEAHLAQQQPDGAAVE
jgi:crossover junction endodeoxyribonuclease RuvC